jgi:hypothetical protein
MRFTYYWWDRRQIPANIFYRDFALRDGLIVYRTNEDRVPGNSWMPDAAALSHPAAEIAD